MGRSDVLGHIDMNKINVYGGSLAYGHPFAATGGRLIMNAMTALQEEQQRFAIATACAAVVWDQHDCGTKSIIDFEGN